MVLVTNRGCAILAARTIDDGTQMYRLLCADGPGFDHTRAHKPAQQLSNPHALLLAPDLRVVPYNNNGTLIDGNERPPLERPSELNAAYVTCIGLVATPNPVQTTFRFPQIVSFLHMY
jgi:hypothetical protein